MRNFRTTAMGFCAMRVALRSTLPNQSRASEVEAALRGLSPPIVSTDCRIVGRTCTTQKKWPWQAALYLHRSDRSIVFTCGGLLIASN